MGGEGIMVPAVQAASAKGGLLDHIRMIQGASAWLHDMGGHAPAAFFAVVCLEEAAKYHVLDSCESHGRGVTAEDRSQIDSHKKRIAMSLQKMRGAARTGGAGQASPARPDIDMAASTIDAIRRLAARREYARGAAMTLECALGTSRLRRVSERLQEAVSLAVASLGSATPAEGGNGHGHVDCGTGVDPILAEIMEASGEIPEAGVYWDDGGMPAGGMHAVLQSLEDHVAVLDKFAADLHKGGHYEASIVMSIMSFEEASRHYVLARRRRHGGGTGGEQAREAHGHGGNMSVFFKDVAMYLGDRNVDRHSKPPGKYAIIHPEMPLRLDGLKLLALHFDHMCGRAITLRGILGDRTGMVSKYLRDTLAGMASWAIICDGDSENPYRRHNANPVHYQRYQELVKFKTDPENEAYDQGMFWLVGRLDRLSGAARGRDVRLCEAEISQILARLPD